MLHVEQQAGVVVWTVDRPQARNALDYATMSDLRAAIEAAAKEPSVRAAVLTGAGHTFVSGGDLRELRDRGSPADAAQLSDAGYELCRAIGELPFPVIAALPGPAIGGGAELAVACDMRVADARATLTFKQVRMGVTTAWGTVPRLLSLVPAGAAARLLYAGHAVTAAEAKLLGLVDQVTEDGLSRATAFAWAADVAQGSPEAIAAMKRLVREAAAARAEDVRRLERQVFVETWSGADHAEAIAAYFERRAPRWGSRRG